MAGGWFHLCSRTTLQNLFTNQKSGRGECNSLGKFMQAQIVEVEIGRFMKILRR